ncbi:GNAT family N-acetyltransferase [Paenibacillus sp. P96]|uniref:GNAT family N-acetyltransferase n=1 Tax=Paenibacillus zeirhizosphaerae TaxID=2987519 RepID=A0ABT9FSJ0_9BACL|nr:hypothetical protein [Paenibacillus sp. P96]MDP4097645.1 GNAT family N-acetyltransferase [Paenibacillus sp. P96]
MNKREIHNQEIAFTIRTATPEDAEQLSELRLRIDGETEYLDREPGEAFIDVTGFKQLIKADIEKPRNLFLVVEVDGRIVGFPRCEGNDLKRLSHKVEFGVCVLKNDKLLADGRFYNTVVMGRFRA